MRLIYFLCYLAAIACLKQNQQDGQLLYHNLQDDLTQEFKNVNFHKLHEISIQQTGDIQKQKQVQEQKIKQDLNQEIDQYMKKQDNLQNILQNRYLTDDQKIEIQEKKKMLPIYMQQKEQEQQGDVKSLISDIDQNEYISGLSSEDKFKEQQKRENKQSYQEIIDLSVQNQLDQIKKEADEETNSSTPKSNDVYDFPVEQKKGQRSNLGSDLNLQLGGYQNQQKQNKPTVQSQIYHTQSSIIQKQMQKKQSMPQIQNFRFLEKDSDDSIESLSKQFDQNTEQMMKELRDSDSNHLYNDNSFELQF